MQATTFLSALAPYAPLQGQEPDALDTLERMLGAGLEVGTILLTSTLAIFVVLVFGVRLLMIVRKLPVPTDPLNMVKPRDFRALMIGAACLLAPLAAWEFLPVEGLDLRWGLVWAYAFELLLAAILWLALQVFYSTRR